MCNPNIIRKGVINGNYPFKQLELAAQVVCPPEASVLDDLGVRVSTIGLIPGCSRAVMFRSALKLHHKFMVDVRYIKAGTCFFRPVACALFEGQGQKYSA